MTIENAHEHSHIVIKNVSKSFSSFVINTESALSYLANIKNFIFSLKSQKKVLDNISFKIKKGEVVGVIGLNGSGKSTLLRALAGVYQVDSGMVECRGQTFYLTNTGLGLMEKLTMKENIFLVGAIMGLSKKEVKMIYNDIVNFSGLADYQNIKINKFSVGMTGRLGFSISIFCMSHKKSEILLLDEVFGSGADFEFEIKAAKKMKELIQCGATVVMVSHNLELLEKYCHRIIWLEGGRLKKIGEPSLVINEYKH